MPSAAPSSHTDLDPARLAELLLAARDGSRTALSDLVVACEPFVCRQASRHAWHRDHIDDVIQEVLFELFRDAHKIRDPKALLGWLSTVTRHAAGRAGRRSGRSVAQELDDDAIVTGSTEDDVLDRWSRCEVTDGVRRALDRLDEDDRTLLQLLHRDERPGYREIGEAVRRPIGSLGPTRQRLLRRLRSDRDIARLAGHVSAA